MYGTHQNFTNRSYLSSAAGMIESITRASTDILCCISRRNICLLQVIRRVT